MKPERWQRIERVFHEAAALSSKVRPAFLDKECGNDVQLRSEVESLLAQNRREGMLEQPAIQAAVPIDRELRNLPRLSAGAHLDSYSILACIGAGGMGEVYRARDMRLDRYVAIKVLPPHLADDALFGARLEREARAVAALNNPHICTLYDVGHLASSAGSQRTVDFLVMEYLEGENLAERLQKGPLPPAQTFRYAIEIADALDAAHRAGITHRDLKPGNIMITKSGVKVLDFGLAKSAQDTSLTGTLAVMGTPAYMAPEQRQGKECDARTDIYALGLTLFEMVTGKPFFQGEPRFDGVPEKLAHVIERCLELEPEERWQTASDVKKELVWSATPHRRTLPPQSVSTGRWVWGAAALVGAIVLGAVGISYLRPAAPDRRLRVVRFAIPQTGASALTISGRGSELTLTPDGSRLVYVGNNGTQLFVRALDALEPVAIASGTTLVYPFVSPDGQWVGYFDNAFVLKKVAITGGPPVTLAATLDSGPVGATWLPDDTIVYATLSQALGLRRVSAVGESSNGSPEIVTRPNPAQGEANHLWPEMLPGGRAVLFTITAQTGGPDASQVAVLDLRTGLQKILVHGTQARYVASTSAAQGSPSGHLVYAAGGTLRTIPFDLVHLETRGNTSPVVPGPVTRQSGDDFAVATDGTLVYVDEPESVAGAARTLVWVDRTGREEPIAAPPRDYVVARVSPDGTRLALTIRDMKPNIWIWDLRRAELTSLRFDPAGFIGSPIWTPDSRRIVFQSTVAGSAPNIWWMAADGTGIAERLTTSTNPQVATAISPDGIHMVFAEATPSLDIFQMTLDGTHQITPLLHSQFWEHSAVVSPEGHWLAYESDSSGRMEIHVCPYPNTSEGRWQVSTGGGRRPLWSSSGNELFFVGGDGALMHAAVEAVGTIWHAGTPTKLLDSRYSWGGTTRTSTYDVSPDGHRFLLIKSSTTNSNATPPQIIVVQHWNEELRKVALH